MRVFGLGAWLTVASALAEPSAAEISKKSKEKGALNVVGLTVEVKLVTVTSDGKTKEQQLSTSSRLIEGKNHALARFRAPASVAGVGVLTVQGGVGDGDDVSLYLPKLKRIRKVAKNDRNKAFMETDFAYADIASNGARDDSLQRLSDEQAEGRDCFVLLGNGDDASAYGQVKLFVDKQTFVPMRVEYQDKAGKPLKRYRTLKLKSFKERVIAAEASMESLQSGSRTTMTVLRLEDSTLGDDAFTEQALERG
jgi:outer membrane lipoprotein-sorting protein